MTDRYLTDEDRAALSGFDDPFRSDGPVAALLLKRVEGIVRRHRAEAWAEGRDMVLTDIVGGSEEAFKKIMEPNPYQLEDTNG